MSTPAQILANRENAQKSTGPTTDEGKAASARNHTDHGLAAKKFNQHTFFMFENEDIGMYEHLRNCLVREYGALGEPSEYLLCEQMAQHSWLRSRAMRLQTNCFDGATLAVAFTDSFNLYVRYETTHDRAFHRCLTTLLKVKEIKAKTGIGFEAHKAQIAAQQAAEERPKPAAEPPKTVEEPAKTPPLRTVSGRDFKFIPKVTVPAAAPAAETTETKAETTTETGPGGLKQAA